MQKSKLSIFEILIAIYYAWFFLPVGRAFFSASIYKYLFFAMFAVGIVGMMFIKGRAFNVPINRLVVVLIAYFAVMSFMYVLDIADASAHIRVSFTFWGTLLLYFFALDDCGKIRLGKFFLLMFIVTCITSSIGVILDNSAARTIAHAAADDELQRAYSMKNIGSIYLFQCMVVALPTMFGLSNTNKSRVVTVLLTCLLFFVLINASFTISLILFVVTLTLLLVFTKTKNKTWLFLKIVAISVLLVLALFGRDILVWFASVVNNARIYERIMGLVELIYGTGVATGDVATRSELYMASWNTFCNNFLLGVGPHYSYIPLDNGLGYHSQILDDMARFGIFAVAFYVIFFTGYYKLLKKEWEPIDADSKVPFLTAIIYALFLLLNIGFRSGIESLVILFILPVLPKLFNKDVKRCQ